MDRSQPVSPLLADSLPESRNVRSSSPHTIPRKPIPTSNAQYSPLTREARDDEAARFHHVNNPTSYSRTVSRSQSRQPDAAHQQHGRFSWMRGRQQKQSSTMTGRLRHITFLCVFLVLPLCGITIALIIVVYQNLLPHSNLASSEPCSGLVINYGASQLTSLSTWISTIATILAPAFMALISYPVAKAMTQHSEADPYTTRLPSPYQTGLLIELLGGSVMGLWGSLSYMVSRRRARVSPLLYLSYAGLLCGVFFGVLTQLADFWLHRATHSILYTVPRATEVAPYGRDLDPYCRNYYATNAASQASFTGQRINGTALNPPCSVVGGEYDSWPRRSDQGFLLANSLPASSSLAVTNFTDESAVDAPQTLVLVLPPAVDSNVTWSAKTVGVNTRCEYLFDRCHTQVDPEGAFFDCGPDVPPVGYNASGPLAWNSSGPSGSGGFFGHILSTLLPGPQDDAPLNVLKNPWTFGLAMRMNAVISGREYDIPDNLPTGTETIFTIVMCNATTYDVEYSVGDQNRNTTSSTSDIPVTVHKIERSSSNVHNTVQGLPLHADPNTKEYLERAMLASVFSSKKNGDVLPRFEQEFGRYALSFAAPSFEGVPTTQRHITQQSVVSCVQPAPLWCLVGLVCVYIVLAIVLAIVANIASAGNGVRSAQSQLSVAGLAAKAFDERGVQTKHQSVNSMEDLFEERNSPEYSDDKDGHPKRKFDGKRVGFKVNDAGRWEYDVLLRQ